jgi:hypothetical protein
VLDFFKTVWEVNQGRPKERRLRVILADTQRPWKAVIKRDDFAKLYFDRDRFMAESILRDLKEHSAEPRHALFIVGYLHAMVNLTAGSEPFKSAGWRLRDTLGQTNVFAGTSSGIYGDNPGWN